MQLSSAILSVSAWIIFSCLTFVLSRRNNARRRRLPPGPRGLPFIGNLQDLPRPGAFEAHHWLKHKDIYGPISSVTVMGQTMIIVNDASLASAMLDKRSAKHSGRPKLVFAGEMIGWKNTIAFQQNDSRFRAMRKRVAPIIASKVSAAKFNQMQEAEVGHFLLHVLNQPQDLMSHIEREAGTLILRISYGYIAETHGQDPLIRMAVDAMDNFGKAAVPGAFLVDTLPFLRYLPNWFPGAAFKRTAEEWHARLTETTELPYAFVKHQMAQKKNERSLVSQLLDVGDQNPEVEWANKWSAMSMYLGGSDTTVSSIATFFLVMTMYPDIQRKAQQEIDRVVGNERLPSFSDRENLPYINAIVKEVLRWAPVVPLSLPHAVAEDDVIEGYHIPKGAVIVPNIWHFLHDEDVYHDPMDFKPERFLEDNDSPAEPDPRLYAFGFGRRICPGRILADNALFLNFAQCLAVLSISKAVRDGKEIEPVVKYRVGLLSRPEPFENLIKPRSAHHEQLIRAIESQYPWQTSDSSVLRDLKRA